MEFVYTFDFVPWYLAKLFWVVVVSFSETKRYLFCCTNIWSPCYFYTILWFVFVHTKKARLKERKSLRQLLGDHCFGAAPRLAGGTFQQQMPVPVSETGARISSWTWSSPLLMQAEVRESTGTGSNVGLGLEGKGWASTGAATESSVWGV